jgi:uncharacterized membrane protein
MLVAVLSLTGAVVSAYVWYKQVTPGAVLCIGTGCATVIRSRYGRLFGIPNGALGVAYFLSVTAVPLLAPWLSVVVPLAIGVTAVALLLYLYLAYLQFFVLRALCSWCLSSAALTAAIFAVLVTQPTG